MVIEDDEFVRHALGQTLELYGFKVHLAEDGPTGLKLARSVKPALILLDWMMPEMDGLEVLSELRRNKKTQRIPVFMLTARGMTGDRDKAIEIGADGYVDKPLDLRRIGELVYDKWQEFTASASVR